VLILLPPSEGKAVPRQGIRLSLDALDFAELTEARAIALTALLDLCTTSGRGPVASTPLHDQIRIDFAAAVLGLGSTQIEEVHRNGRLLTAPTARADRIYTGVLYDALDLASLEAPARRRATRWLAIISPLFGVVRPNDQIPAYRLRGDVSLPGLGTVSSHWRRHLEPVLADAAGSGLVIDLRSSMYAPFWRPTAEIGSRVATMRVLHQVGKERKVVSHFNKATKGRIVRDLLNDGSAPDTPEDLADHLAELGWTVEVHLPTRTSQQLDVIVDEV
jgi:uncharacterized protein